MAITQSGNVVTITGNPNVGEYLTLIVNRQHTYSYVAVQGDTAASVAAAIVALISADFPGATVLGNAASIVPDPGLEITDGFSFFTLVRAATSVFEIVARIGAVGTMGHVIHRQKQQVKVSVWAANSALRASVAGPLDIALKQNLKLTFNDTSQGVMTYQNTMNDDNPTSLRNLDPLTAAC